MSAPEPGQVRRLLLGLEGPYADPRVATDALDNLAVLVDELPDADRAGLAVVLLGLVRDPDVIVATGAVLGLGRVVDDLPTAALADAVTCLPEADLDRSPVGFASISRPTLRAELAVRLAPVLARHDPTATASLLAHPPSGVERADLGMAVAPIAADLVLEHATDWFGPDDIGVVLRLPSHWYRIAAAGALAPWPDSAHRSVDQAAQWQRWADGDTAAVHRAMTGTDPVLNRPDGIDDGRRWRIVAGTTYGWTLWRADDGTLAREVLDPGPAWTTTTRLLTADEVASIATRGVAAAADLE